jgi:hypothetical protein
LSFDIVSWTVKRLIHATAFIDFKMAVSNANRADQLITVFLTGSLEKPLALASIEFLEIVRQSEFISYWMFNV